MKRKPNLLAALLALCVLLNTAGCANPAQEDASEDPAPTSASEETPHSSASSEAVLVPEPAFAPESEVQAPSPVADAALASPRVLETLEPMDSSDELYSLNISDYTLHALRSSEERSELTAALDALTHNDAEPVVSGEEALCGFLTVRDSVKTSYYVTQSQVYSESAGAVQVYQSSAESRDALCALAQRMNEKYRGTPRWLAYMSIDRITMISCGGLDLEKLNSAEAGANSDCSFKVETTDRSEIDSLARLLKQFRVLPGETEVINGGLNPNLCVEELSVTIDFDSAVHYSLLIDEESLGIRSSDRPETLFYRMPSRASADKLRAVALELAGCSNGAAPDRENPLTGKPVIYLYPETKTDVTVRLDFQGQFTYTFPTYGDGWEVTAYPDGRLVNKADDTEHFYLFWEGNSDHKWSFDEGFCVAGGDTETFLREKLAYLGLTPREYNDFLVYWVPELQSNPYNVITFATQEYEQLAPLAVTPAPDSVLRVHMVYKPVDAPIALPAQTLQPFERKGFTVVEWGGSRGGRVL